MSSGGVSVLAERIRHGQEHGETGKQINAALTLLAPDIDAVTGVAGAAAWLGKTPKTIYSERVRKRADGTPRWPEPTKMIGRAPHWSWRTLAWHAATMPQGFRNAAHNE